MDTVRNDGIYLGCSAASLDELGQQKKPAVLADTLANRIDGAPPNGYSRQISGEFVRLRSRGMKAGGLPGGQD